VAAALDAFRPEGDVLELAYGPGIWTELLLRHATSVTAVDAAPEMLALARARVGEERVRFMQADLFAWRPDRRHDVVFFGFWFSHVPRDRFEAFWSLVDDCLKPEGRVFLVDGVLDLVERAIHERDQFHAQPGSLRFLSLCRLGEFRLGLGEDAQASSRPAKSVQDARAHVGPFRSRLARSLRCLGPTIQLPQPRGFPVRVARAVDARNNLRGELESLVLG
jgi:SAM-dependent methyltransferase